MCRLFGMSSAPQRVRATFWLLDAADSLAAQSRREPDGVGLGTFRVDGTPEIHKAPIAAYQDPVAERDHQRRPLQVCGRLPDDLVVAGRIECGYVGRLLVRLRDVEHADLLAARRELPSCVPVQPPDTRTLDRPTRAGGNLFAQVAATACELSPL